MYFVFGGKEEEEEEEEDGCEIENYTCSNEMMNAPHKLWLNLYYCCEHELWALNCLVNTKYWMLNAKSKT